MARYSAYFVSEIDFKEFRNFSQRLNLKSSTYSIFVEGHSVRFVEFNSCKLLSFFGNSNKCSLIDDNLSFDAVMDEIYRVIKNA